MTITIDTNTSAGIVLILGAMGSVIIQIIQALTSYRNRQDLKSVHDKADTAILQNEQIVKQTDGNYSEMVKLLNHLLDTVRQQALNGPRTVVVTPGPATPREVRKEDMKERSTDPK